MTPRRLFSRPSVSPSIKHFVLALWNGQLPLARAFWLYAVIYGSLANLLGTLLSLATISAGIPGVFAAILHILPLPYNILVSVGSWRSADRYKGPPFWAALARAFVVLWAIAATLA
jgi:hypothetical protein